MEMKWWYWLVLELLIIFGVMAWVYFFPSEIEEDFAKGLIGFVLFYLVEERRKTMDYKEDIKITTEENEDEKVTTEGFKKELTSLLNRYSWDNACETPDHILADYVEKCLVNFCGTINRDIAWHENWKRLGEDVNTFYVKTENKDIKKPLSTT